MLDTCSNPPSFVRRPFDQNFTAFAVVACRTPYVRLPSPYVPLTVFVRIIGGDDLHDLAINRLAELACTILSYTFDFPAGFQRGNQSLILNLRHLSQSDPSPIAIQVSEVVEELGFERIWNAKTTHPEFNVFHYGLLDTLPRCLAHVSDVLGAMNGAIVQNALLCRRQAVAIYLRIRCVECLPSGRSKIVDGLVLFCGALAMRFRSARLTRRQSASFRRSSGGRYRCTR